MREATVAVVVPTYNEAGNIRPLVERLARLTGSIGEEIHVFFVDDGSPDGTPGEVRNLTLEHTFLHLIERQGKRGLGTAYQEGFRRALETVDPSVFVQMDADLQHPPEKIPELVRAIHAGADVAVASRYIPGGDFRGLNRRRRVVSKGANWLSRRVLGLSARDTTTGFRALDRRAVETLLAVRLQSRGFIFQVESLYIFKRRGLVTVEVPFVFEERSKGASKMSAREAWEFLRSVLAMRFRDY